MAKQENTDRQKIIDDIRKGEKSATRRKGTMIITVAVTLGLIIIVAAAWKPFMDARSMKEFKEKDLAAIGAGPEVCTDITTQPASGMQDHVTPGTAIDYGAEPPAFGQHYDSWEDMERKFYSDDRPEAGFLVHNLEHGYTILWYDETIAADSEQLAVVKGLAGKFTGDDARNKFKAVPWTEEDGEAFPEGQHIAMTHWSAGGTGEMDQAKQVGVRQYCSEPSGAALDDFMTTYTYMDSPEPNGG